MNSPVFIQWTISSPSLPPSLLSLICSLLHSRTEVCLCQPGCRARCTLQILSPLAEPDASFRPQSLWSPEQTLPHPVFAKCLAINRPCLMPGLCSQSCGSCRQAGRQTDGQLSPLFCLPSPICFSSGTHWHRRWHFSAPHYLLCRTTSLMHPSHWSSPLQNEGT